MKKRIDFVWFFDVINGNPNGDPDADNQPRTIIKNDDCYGFMTDVSIKRKIRDYVELMKGSEDGFDIFIKDDTIMNAKNCYKENGGVLTEKGGKQSKSPSPEELSKCMSKKFFDWRVFGGLAAISKNGTNASEAIHINFPVSVDPVEVLTATITMKAKNSANEGKEKTMGRKHFLPYAMYKVSGGIKVPAAMKNQMTEEDFNLVMEALMNMFNVFSSSTKGQMSSVKLYTFEHDTEIIGNAQRIQLEKCITAQRIAYNNNSDDYTFELDENKLPKGIHVKELM